MDTKSDPNLLVLGPQAFWSPGFPLVGLQCGGVGGVYDFLDDCY